ncbi:hypothetical protein [Celerinatantimonas diazotrophica]|uniref:Uncharacterized protein n=1 Tax=Celerinatantimonas diazotrophica TaxID=412034 RepID=A0A4R1J7E8_9GAMM|nr:hypothetical protein [Celerinatantimonas diazotrophica]TCK46412.1 hypothetical protein EV690_3691 [Celerinatantimonas diazotrophica]CAG9295212.1 hypothetical protein CEDIAZO_00324 [Celerinatantimonas diazotrophica]
MINSLVATTSFEQIAQGDYIDKLSFNRLGDVAFFDPNWLNAGEKVDNPINGYWLLPGSECALELAVVSDYGLIQGQLLLADQSTIAIQGFTDTQASLLGETPWRQSVSFNVCCETQILSFSGYLDVACNQLKLTRWQAHGTAPGDEYLQASAAAYHFVR